MSKIKDSLHSTVFSIHVKISKSYTRMSQQAWNCSRGGVTQAKRRGHKPFTGEEIVWMAFFHEHGYN